MQNLTSFEKHNKKRNSFDLSFDFSHYFLHFCRNSAKTAFIFSKSNDFQKIVKRYSSVAAADDGGG